MQPVIFKLNYVQILSTKFSWIVSLQFRNAFKADGTLRIMVKKSAPIPKISVVMSVYNEEKFIDESIRSILNQTFKDFEFIIINNGSTDNTLKIIKSYKDKRIKIINKRRNVGTSKAVNLGFKKAKGKYIASFCGDDISHPKRLEIEFNYLESHPEIFLVGASAVYINESGKEIQRFRKYDDYRMLSWRLRKSCSIIYPSIMFHNENFFLDVNTKTNDYNFYFELLKNGKKLTNLPYFLTKYRVHPGSLSVYKKKEFDLSKKQVLERFKSLEDKTDLFDKMIFSIKLFFHYIRTIREKRARLI